MKNDELIARLVALVKEETNNTLGVLALLRMVDDRSLHLEMGYRSLFIFAMEHLGYSEGAAGRRIGAMRLIRSEPSAEAKIASGKLSLSVAATAQSFSNKNGISPKQAIKTVEGKGTRNAKRALFELCPQAIPEEKTRVVSATQTEIRIIVDDKFLGEMNLLRDLLAHSHPAMSYLELFQYLTELGLKKHDPARKAKITPATESQCSTESQSFINSGAEGSAKVQRPPGSSRYISAKVRRMIWQRDQGKCCYTDPVSGRRCGSRYGVQTDHRFAWSLGGSSEPENLGLLCRAHNQWKSDRRFGTHSSQYSVDYANEL